MSPELEQDSQFESLVQQLSAHRLAGAAPSDEIRWLATHGQLRRLETGEILSSRATGVVQGLYIFLSGHIALFVQRANGREKTMEWRGGDVGGLLPYSRLTAPPGDVFAQEPTDLVMIRRDLMPELIHQCPVFTTALVHTMVDRARHFTSSGLQAEKMASLGKLSAGLAHELNNPAAAIARSSGSLQNAVVEAQRAAAQLGALQVGKERENAIEAVRDAALSGACVARTPLEQADRESDFECWLSRHELDWDLAATLAETPLTLEALDELARLLSPPPQLCAAVRYIATSFSVRQLTEEIHVCANRISTLIRAVKGFTTMDQSATPGPVHVVAGLQECIAIHGGKARSKSASLRLDVEEPLPHVDGIAGELNQVWANLLDNALDAVLPSGSVTITACRKGSMVEIQFTDDGAGIPADIQSRIFDPFFTTKRVGEGVGLGLDAVRRIVSKHQGTVGVQSRPGWTQFTVALPLAAAS